MITKFKLYESKDIFLLYIKEPDPDYYYKFTKGKKYKIYSSNLGLRIKDDNGKFDKLIGVGNDGYRKIKNDNGIITWNYADGIFTSDNSIEDYNLRNLTKKYNL